MVTRSFSLMAPLPRRTDKLRNSGSMAAVTRVSRNEISLTLPVFKMSVSVVSVISVPSQVSVGLGHPKNRQGRAGDERFH